MSELAADGVPVAVTCRVLNIARQPYYRWHRQLVTSTEYRQAHVANAVFDAHHDDRRVRLSPVGRSRREGRVSCGTAHDLADLCRQRLVGQLQHEKPKPSSSQRRSPAHDDLVRRDFTADGPDRLWLTDLTEHPTAEGKLHVCAIKDVWSNRIVGYSIDERMT